MSLLAALVVKNRRIWIFVAGIVLCHLARQQRWRLNGAWVEKAFVMSGHRSDIGLPFKEMSKSASRDVEDQLSIPTPTY